ncbi:MAG: hypothetical protein ACRC33_29300 [Gemmataceae bacterium]
MRRLIALTAVLTLPLLFTAGPAAQAQKTKKADADKDKDADTKNTEKTVKSGVLIGKVMNVYEDKRRLRIQVSIPVTKYNAGAAQGVLQAQQNLVNAQVAMRSARDVNGLVQARQQMAQAQLEMARAQAQLYQTELVNQEVEVDAIEDVVVRMASPKQDFDEKGRVKKYTKAELKELKGEGKHPGYKAEFSDIQNEQIIRVTTVRKKGEPAPKPAPVKKKKGKDDDAPSPADGLADKQPQVSLIEILREAPVAK